jgi:class 3 adenylate cyclase
MACTGVPDKQPDHAVILVRFAAACLKRMEHLGAELAGALGDDTKQLSMRIGINSGPVMGGVLRGVRARFQVSFYGLVP